VISTCISAFYNNETSTHARSFNTARTHAPLTRLMPCFSMETIIMLSSSEFDIHMVIGHCIATVTHLHAIIILWVRVGRLLFDRYIDVLSYCEFDRHIVMLSSSCESLKLLPRLTLLQWHIVMLSPSCGYDRQIGNDSAFYHHRVSSTFMSTSTRGRVIIE
jgi:hypothetical protein